MPNHDKLCMIIMLLSLATGVLLSWKASDKNKKIKDAQAKLDNPDGFIDIANGVVNSLDSSGTLKLNQTDTPQSRTDRLVDYMNLRLCRERCLGGIVLSLMVFILSGCVGSVASP